MRKTIKYLSMAALVMVGATMTSCSSDDALLGEVWKQEVNENGKVTLSTTISMDGDETRALTENGVKTFAVGEQIAVIYTNSSDQTVKAVSVALTEDDIADGNKSASFTVTLDNPKAGTIKYVYPAVMANDDGTMASISTQDGTLESLSKNLDYGFWSGDWNGTALPEGKKLGNQLAICKFTVMGIGGNDVTSSLSSFSVSDGTNTYNVTSSSLSTIYLAMLPVNNANLDFTLVGADVVKKKVTGKTLEAGNMYPITVSLIPSGNEIYYIRHSWNGSALVSEWVYEPAQGCLNNLGNEYNQYLSGTWYVTGELKKTGIQLHVSKGRTLNLVLCDGAKLNIGNIIVNGEGTTLRIFGQRFGTGELSIKYITNGYPSPNIGPGGSSGEMASGGVVEFHGGILSTDAHAYQPVIGSNGQGNGDLNRIAIYGGKLTVKAGSQAAAIGGGENSTKTPIIDIYGGDIDATGGDATFGVTGAAGIGGGQSSALSEVNIYGGTIKATGGPDAAGIGNSQDAPVGEGVVNIYGGTVIAQGAMAAAGIGGGDKNHIASINIYGGTVNAYAGNDGAGIGGGEDGDSGDINIYGGTVYAYGGKKYDGSSNDGYGAGIGSGQNGNVNNIKIYGGNVHAYGGMDAAGIGTGEEYGTDINSGTIEIHGGSVYAEGKGYGVGIGAGQDATFGVLGISGGRVDAHGDPNYCGPWSGAIGAYHSSHSDGCHIGWAGWQRIYIGAGMRLWTYSPNTGIENVTNNLGWWNYVHERPQVAFGVCDHPGYTEATCPFCYRTTLCLE